MPRTLPWQAAGNTKSSINNGFHLQRERHSNLPPEPEVNVADDSIRLTKDNAYAKPRIENKFTCTPPSSPPPFLSRTEYIRQGYDEDDGWIMVEDEFNATANLFTRHIHRAAYASWKEELQKADKFGSLDTFTRPTDDKTPMSNKTILKLERTSVQSMAGGELEDDLEQTNPLLAGIISKSQHDTQDLSDMAGVRPKTRAAAGFTQSPRKLRKTWKFRSVDDSEQEDRDSLTPRQRRNSAIVPVVSRTTIAENKDFKKVTVTPLSKSGNVPVDAALSNDMDTAYGENKESSVCSDRTYIDKSVMSVDTEPTPNTSLRGQMTTSDFLARQRARREKRRQEAEQKIIQRVDDVPTWLID